MSGHDRSHGHAPASGHGRAFATGIALNTAFVAVELVFGLRAHSLALISDAGHNFGDVLGLALAWWASNLARRSPTLRRTYGLRRSTILAALANAILLLIAVGAIVWEAAQRLVQPQPVEAGTVIWVAAAGVVINGVSALLFLSGRKDDLNIRGAFLHMASDAVVSLGVVATGIAMQLAGWLWLDPVVSIAIAVIITVGTWGLLRESMDLAMDAVPVGINPLDVESYLAALADVEAVHDLHIWGMSTTETALTAHLIMRRVPVSDAFLQAVSGELHERFGIEHTTIQFEHGDAEPPCVQAPSEVV